MRKGSGKNERKEEIEMRKREEGREARNLCSSSSSISIQLGI